MSAQGAFCLPKRMVEKVWGRAALPAPFDGQAPAGCKIGEIWFEPPPQLDQLLVKYLFTSEKLSVQVHPGDENALADEAGKEECWLVLHAEPGAKLAIGFDEELTGADIKKAALDGSIEDKLTWHDAAAGDVFYLPAGTVHAIGAGLTLVEVQQNSDTTFRLFDYGRPRALHLERALAVAHGGPYDLANHSKAGSHSSCLVDAPHFRFDRLEGAPDADIERVYDGPLLALPLEGYVAASQKPAPDLEPAKAEPGDCLYAASIDTLDFSLARVTLLIRPN